jgi:Rrf2 family protein
VGVERVTPPLRATARVDYALKAMTVLAEHEGVHVPGAFIAASFQMSPKMLGSILGSLADAGLVEAKRGWHGGYALRAPAREISVAAVIAAVSGPLKTSDPDALAASAAASASARNVVDEFWRLLDSGLQTHLSALSLADLVTEVGGREKPA